MNKSTIMIVDDQPMIRLLLRSQLKEFNIVEASCGKDALQKLEEQQPDLILLDVVMPDMDGYQVLAIVKSSPLTRLIPVILVTSLEGSVEKVKSLEIGADDFITKPFKPVELLARVKSLLRIKALQDDLANAHNVVFSLAQALEARDDYSMNHSQRTSDYAERLAREIGYANPERIRTAGLLHDIGKIGVRDNVLLKPGILEPEEFELIKKHPTIGERICASITGFHPLLPIIRNHHEHFDGNGYPDGLKGKDIPLGARIIAVADTFDALTSNRPYRNALSREKAVSILRERAGIQWDEDLVAIFCQLVEQGEIK